MGDSQTADLSSPTTAAPRDRRRSARQDQHGAAVLHREYAAHQNQRSHPFSGWREARTKNGRLIPPKAVIDAKGMEMELTTSAPPPRPGVFPSAKAKNESISGVKRIVLKEDVIMNLYVAGGGPFPGGKQDARQESRAAESAQTLQHPHRHTGPIRVRAVQGPRHGSLRCARRRRAAQQPAGCHRRTHQRGNRQRYAGMQTSGATSETAQQRYAADGRPARRRVPPMQHKRKTGETPVPPVQQTGEMLVPAIREWRSRRPTPPDLMLRSPPMPRNSTRTATISFTTLAKS